MTLEHRKLTSPQKLVAMCNRCGYKWPISEEYQEDYGWNILIELPCQKCGYLVNAVLACETEAITPLGALGTLPDFEKLNPGPLNITEQAFQVLEPDTLFRVKVAGRNWIPKLET